MDQAIGIYLKTSRDVVKRRATMRKLEGALSVKACEAPETDATGGFACPNIP